MWNSLALVSLVALAGPQSQLDGSRAAVERAVLDYAESYYLGKPEYVERSVDPELSKLGYIRDQSGGYMPHPMTFEQLRRMAAGIRDGEWKAEPGPKEVEILDLLDQTALVKLTGSWGIDYMQLSLQDGGWKTRHVLWQSAPASVNEEARARDRKAVRRATTDYLEALYDVRPELIERGVDADLVKYGYWHDEDRQTYRGMAMTFAELRALAGEWNAEGKLTDDAPREIEVLDVMDQIACVKLTAEWGVDTMLLARKEGVWKIVYVMWQSHPARAAKEASAKTEE